MKSIKISCLLTSMLFFTTSLSAQYHHFIHVQFGKNGAPASLNYNHLLYKTKDESLQILSHIGLGNYAFSETIATKYIKGETVYGNTGSLLIDLLFHYTFSTKDQTIERRQYFSISNINIGSKIVLGNKAVQIELGLNSRLYFIKQNIDAWDNEASQSKRFTQLMIAPSTALKYNIHNLAIRFGGELHKTYGKQASIKYPLFFGIGIQF